MEENYDGPIFGLIEEMSKGKSKNSLFYTLYLKGMPADEIAESLNMNPIEVENAFIGMNEYVSKHENISLVKKR